MHDNRTKTRKTIRSSAVIFLFLIFAGVSFTLAESPGETVFTAMEDELNRTMQKLKMENLDKPYYVEFVVTDFQNFEIDSAFGDIVRIEDSRSRYFAVDLRVGDYSFDNTNFISDYYGTRQRPVAISFEDNYDALRQDIWLATDRAYKDALEKLARKKAYVQTKAITDLTEDLAKEEPYVEIAPKAELSVDKKSWEKTVAELSAIFKEYPGINDSSVTFKAVAINRYFLNNEGFKSRKGTFIILLEAAASTQAEDGQSVSNFKSFYARDAGGLPEKENAAAKIRVLAQKTLDLSRSVQLTEYVGPVIFTEEASGEFFRQLLAANISSPQTPLVADERFSEMIQKPKLASKLNLRILPPFFDVADDPAIMSWNGSHPIGFFNVDDDGVPAKKVSHQKDGKLVDLLMSRIPTKKIKSSNGHARGAVYIPVEGRQSNLFITSKETMSYQSLKERLIELCRDMGLEYGIIVKKLRDKNLSLQTDSEADLTPAQAKTELCFPVEAYRISVKDGKEELIRGLEFEGTTVRALKDIIAAGDDAHLYNFMLGHNFELPASIVSPSVLVEEMELKKTESKPSKLPLLKSPLQE